MTPGGAAVANCTVQIAYRMLQPALTHPKYSVES
jgi:hypothetical protein